MSGDQTLYVVSGFMRTGTSMMMRALEAGGLEACYSQSRDDMKNQYADEHYDPNLGGLYELNRAEYLKSTFPRGYEGKLIKALGPGVPKMAVMKYGMRVIFMRRDSEEIRQSYNAFFGTQLDITDLDSRMDRIIERIHNRKDVQSLAVFWFRDVVNQPLEYFQKLMRQHWPIDTVRSANQVDPALVRYRREDLVEGVL